jgi:hypothetical protein
MITVGVVGALAFGLLLFQLTRPKSVVAPGSAAPAVVAAPAAEAVQVCRKDF